jgi:2-oxoglutarate ferredoxin oxidoreductase subunit alpha
MVVTRLNKVLGIADSFAMPPITGSQEGDVLVIGWGSTYGAIRSAVEQLSREGLKVGHMQMRHIWPLPHGLSDVFARYKRILVPELNMGQLSRLLSSEFLGVKFEGFNKVQGKPFRAAELRERITSMTEAQA